MSRASGAAEMALSPGASHMAEGLEITRPLAGPPSRAAREENAAALPTCERPSRSSSPFVPGKDLLAGLVAPGDHPCRQAHAGWRGRRRGRGRGEPIGSEPRAPAVARRGASVSMCLSPSPATGQDEVLGGFQEG